MNFKRKGVYIDMIFETDDPEIDESSAYTPRATLLRVGIMYDVPPEGLKVRSRRDFLLKMRELLEDEIEAEGK